MNGFDSEEQLKKQREELEDAMQQARAIIKQAKWDFWSDVLTSVATGLVVYGIGYLVYVAIGG